MRMILARPVGFSQAGWRERETVSGIVIVLACDREKMLIVVKLDLAYEKVWKHSVLLGKSDISSWSGTAVNQTNDREMSGVRGQL